MRTVQLMKKKYIYSVCTTRIIAKKIGSHDTNQTFINNHCQECVGAYETSMIV